MGQTLTHGVYLPDEGERNCYSGLAANWQILDSSVGTIAAHTAALSGKAPLVHTHTKSDITDFPAYGTTAGTICEGNDSRLSDARTPVAHTHTKSDITDLFNSANVWSNYNSYSKGIELAGNRYAYILPEFAANYSGISILTNSFGKSVKFGSYTTDENSVISLDTTLGFIEISAGLANDVNSARIHPRNAAVAELGTSNYKWKTLNGINPGALSLPDYNNVLDVTSNIPVASLDGTTQINLNDYLADKTGWLSIVIDDTAGNSIMVTQGKTGGATAYNNSRTFHTGAQSNGYISVFFPMIAGLSQKAFIKASSLIQMRFYYCLGNV